MEAERWKRGKEQEGESGLAVAFSVARRSRRQGLRAALRRWRPGGRRRPLTAALRRAGSGRGQFRPDNRRSSWTRNHTFRWNSTSAWYAA